MNSASDKSDSAHQAVALSDDHYSATQLRADRWSSLQDVSQRLAQASNDRKGVKRLRDQALELLHMLEPIEMFWAFPGHFVFERLTLLLNNEEFDDFASVVKRIVRATSSGYYRRRTVPLIGDDAEFDHTAEEEESPEARA